MRWSWGGEPWQSGRGLLQRPDTGHCWEGEEWEAVESAAQSHVSAARAFGHGGDVDCDCHLLDHLPATCQILGCLSHFTLAATP